MLIETFTSSVEYSIYSDLIYNLGRKKVLNHFPDRPAGGLAMPQIFKTEVFRERLEGQARVNLNWELERLS